MTHPITWTHATTEIPDRGLERTRSADEAERAAVAEALSLIACDRLNVSYVLAPAGAGAWRLTGDLVAAVTQACIVSLEPVPAALAETFSVEFRRDAPLADPEGEREILAGPDVEPLAGDHIEVGRIVYETLSAGIDPYPRKAGAALDWNDPRAGDEAAGNPFAVLKKLKDKG